VKTAKEPLVRYDCPHCRVGLASVVGRWRGWLLCPACGKPGLPPAPLRARYSYHQARTLSPEGAGLRAEAWIASGDLPDENWPLWSRGAPIRPSRPSRRESLVRTFIAAGLIVSLFCLLVGYLDRSGGVAGFGGLGTLIFLWLRVRTSR